MSSLANSVLLRFCTIILLTFILMRIFYIYFHQYLQLKYIHFPTIPGHESNKKPSTMKSMVKNGFLNTTRSKESILLRKQFKSRFSNHSDSGNGTNSVLFRNKKQLRLLKKPLYEDWENRLVRKEVSWEDFVNYPRQPPRSKLNIPVTARSSLRSCPTTLNNSLYNSSQIARKGCNDIWSDVFIEKWKSRKVKGLCEDSASSKIHCYDSIFKTRFCIIENAMLNFKKIRKRKQEGLTIRAFEKGFLSADCGETAPEDIGYYQLYSPDIEHKDDLPCDFIFNETMLLYSHDNIRHIGSMITDYLNIWAMLSLAGLSRYSRDISLLNMDDFIAPQHQHHRKTSHHRTSGASSVGFDQMNHFFRNYNVSFRRLIRANEFFTTPSQSREMLKLPPPRVCIKRLLLPPKPLLPYGWEVRELHDPSNHYDCPAILISSLLQRWNLQIRNHYHLLSAATSTTPSAMASLPSSAGGGGATIHDFPTNYQMKILLLLRSQVTNQIRLQSPTTSASLSSHYQSRLFSNAEEVIQQLKTLFAEKITRVDIEVEVVYDLIKRPYEEQARLLHSASVVIGMNGGEIATSSIHLPVGTTYCCGIVEIFPETSANRGVASNRKVGYGQLARRLGHVYERFDVPPSSLNSHSGSGQNSNSSEEVRGTRVPIGPLKEIVNKVYSQIIDKGGSCFLSDVLKNPF